MAIVGFDFTKINVEKKSSAKGNIKINNNVSIKSVDEQELTLGTLKQKALKFTFSFNTKYEPDLATISLEGFVLYITKPEQVKEISENWKKSKKLPKEIMTPILNTVLAKCNIQALILSSYLNLPSPIPLPKVEEKIEKPAAGKKA
jgi:hypothetical protein